MPIEKPGSSPSLRPGGAASTARPTTLRPSPSRALAPQEPATAEDSEHSSDDSDSQDEWDTLAQHPVRRRTDHRPAEPIPIAAGIGFVASVALIWRFSARVFAGAFRLALLPMLERRIPRAFGLASDDDDGR